MEKVGKNLLGERISKSARLHMYQKAEHTDVSKREKFLVLLW